MSDCMRASLGALVIGCLWFTFSPIASADSLQELLSRGNQAYFQGDFESATEAYEELNSLGVVDPDICFNLGTSYARQHRYGQAIQYFQRSLWLRPGDDAARQGLDLSRSALGHRRAESSGEAEVEAGPPLDEAIFGSLSGSLLATTALVASWIFFGLCLVLLYARAEALRLGIWIALPLVAIVTLVSGAGNALKSGAFDEGARAVILDDELPLREGPDDNATLRSRAPEGHRAWLLEEDGRWSRIRVPSIGEGWAPSESVGRITIHPGR